jgi:hypothetical protein
MTDPTVATPERDADPLDHSCRECGGWLLADDSEEPPNCLQCGRTAGPAPAFREPGHEPLLSLGPAGLNAEQATADQQDGRGQWPTRLPDLSRRQ